ncbi:TlpA family protein disulfide reductase [Paenibacillus sp. 481]|uniref:TlpA family protein disulfide reductase n=1 Tax=Paenibacillus sp. 481 TaxID=2835869 RepID=UPI001E30F356|nr:TlpA disulfide reductase family protein [Paenibacillus sp. 481]UHA71984.1 TlpA family protein disulfide reductase [Paenibacillus sp. 481]
MELGQSVPSVEYDLPYLNCSSSNILTDSFEEETLLCYFWSISCGTCKEIATHLQRDLSEYPTQVKLVSVHVPFSEDERCVESITNFSNSNHYAFPIILDQYHEYVSLFNLKIVPVFLLFNRDKVLQHKIIGVDGYKKVKELLKGN